MTTTADVLAAIDAEGSTSWQIADTLAGFDETDDKGRPMTLKGLSERIYAERGVEWSPKVLGTYRATAVAFPREARASLPTQTFMVALELRAHPDKLLKWKPTKAGDVLTKERARALRGGGSAAKSATSRDAVAAKTKRIVGQLESLVELEPELVLDTLAALVDEWRAKYAKRLARLAVVG